MIVSQEARILTKRHPSLHALFFPALREQLIRTQFSERLTLSRYGASV